MRASAPRAGAGRAAHTRGQVFFTERGFQLASDALQVFGGYGYVHEIPH